MTHSILIIRPLLDVTAPQQYKLTVTQAEQKPAEAKPMESQDFIIKQYEKLLWETQQKLQKANEENVALQTSIEKNNDVVSKLIDRILVIKR